MEGKPIQYKSTGTSLQPLVCSGDTCFLYPYRPENTTLEVGDIVFCQAMDRGYFWTHLIWKTTKYWHYGLERDVYWIGNNKPGKDAKLNGWCFDEHIFGYLVGTQRGSHRDRDFKAK